MRNNTLIDLDWRFAEGDVTEAQHPEFDDTTWRQVDLPHDWSIEHACDPEAITGKAGGFFPAGIGWYRKHIQVSKEQLESRLFVEFEGVYMNSTAWLNGEELGFRSNGYITFQYELTGKLREGENILAVRVDCSSLPNCRWYSGCGIYRHVRLIERHNVSIGQWGTWIRTSDVSLKQARTDLTITVDNHLDSRQAVQVKTDIIAPNNQTVATAFSGCQLPAQSSTEIEASTLIPNPDLWSCENPALYKAVTQVIADGKIMDSLETVFGVRTVEFTPQRGFLLNGRKVMLKGLNIHHDLGCLGAAAHDRAIERRLQTIKDAGFNSIRLSHNPHAPYLLDCCDRMGILVYDECFDKWKDYKAENGKKTIPFEQTWQEDLGDFVRRDRNHPCVFIWSVGNETSQQFGRSIWDSEITLPDFGVGQLEEKIGLVKQLDPTRKVTCALYPARQGGIKWNEEGFEEGDPAEMAFHMDVVSSNYLERFYARDHERFPQLMFIASEVTTNQGAKAWFSIDRDYCCGIYFWGGVDYLGESIHGWPLKGWATGLIDTCDRPKAISNYTKSLFTDEPLVHIGVYHPKDSMNNPGAVSLQWNDVLLDWNPVESHWNWETDKELALATYTNCDEVRLLLNDRVLGAKKLGDCEDRLMEWNVPYESGTLTAMGYRNGKLVASHTLKTTGAAERLEIVTPRTTLQADGMDVLHLDVRAVDADGLTVPDSRNRIQWRVEGPARVIGADNGDLTDVESYAADNRRLNNGECILVLRTTQEAGKISLTVHSEELGTVSTELRSC